MERRDLFKVLEDIVFEKETIDSGYPGISNEQPELKITFNAEIDTGIVLEFDSETKNSTIKVYLAENGEGIFKRTISFYTFAKIYAEGKIELFKRGGSQLKSPLFPLFQHHRSAGMGGPIC
jgi:hypothetical protein